MKKALKIFGIFIILVIAILIALPILFKDDIKKAIDYEIEQNVNGTVYFDASSFDISLIRNFPNLSVRLEDFGVIGVSKFEDDTLLDVNTFSITFDVISIVSGDKLKMKSLLLDGVYFNGIVLKDSTANYLDIIKDTITKEDVRNEIEEETPTEFGFAGKWAIVDAHIMYRDEILNMNVEIKNFNHEGKGDFTQDVFDLASKTNLTGLTFEMDGDKFLDNAAFSSKVSLNMDLKNLKYTFNDNLLKLNDFSFGFGGWLQINEDKSVGMDVSFETKETKFKNVLSLVPGMFMEGFESMKTAGTLGFNGAIKGKYDSLNMPAIDFNLKVVDAMFQYPDLPSSVENIAVDFAMKSEQNKLEEMQINLNQFHLDMGANPVDAKTEVKFKGSFDKMFIDSDVNAKINLSEVSKFFPMEGLDVKGIFSLVVKAMGTLDMENNTFPSSKSNMSLKDGYVKSDEFPAPIEALNFNTSIQNENGSLEQTNIVLDQFSLLMDGDPWNMTAKVNDLEAINFDVSLGGKIDFEKITKIVPLDGISLKGLLEAKLSTKGSMKDIEAENYGNIPTSGQMVFTNFEYYDDENLPQGFKMQDALLAFTPSKIEIAKLIGEVGNSDINVTGELSNYINYAFGENETLKGKMNFASNQFDVDEWMVEEEGAESAPTTEGEDVPLEVIELPKDIDFILSSSIKDVKYDNMGMKNLKGDIVVKDGKACFDDCYFQLIGGEFVLNGCYDPSDMKHPMYSFDMDIKNAQIAEAYKVFNTIQKLAPIAKNMNGSFSTNFKFSGELDQEMMPIMEVMNGAGLISIDEAKLTSSDFLSKVGKLTGLKDLETGQLSSMLLDADIKEGRLHLKPFDTKIGSDYLINTSGSNGVDGTLDYVMKMDVPTGKLGAAAGSAVSGLLGTEINTDRVNLNVLVGGLMGNPKLKLNKSGAQKSATEAVTETVKNEVTETVTEKKEEVIKDAKAEAQKQADQLLATAQKQADQVKAQAKKTAARIKKEGYANAAKLESSSKNPIQKKINKVAANELRKTADKQAGNTMSEGNKQADGIMSKARKKATDLLK